MNKLSNSIFVKLNLCMEMFCSIFSIHFKSILIIFFLIKTNMYYEQVLLQSNFLSFGFFNF